MAECAQGSQVATLGILNTHSFGTDHEEPIRQVCGKIRHLVVSLFYCCASVIEIGVLTL